MKRFGVLGDTIPYEEIMQAYDPQKYEIEAYIIKEVNYIDAFRLNLESRAMEICPVVKNNQTNKTKELFWLYFPNTRNCLAQHKLNSKNLPKHIKTLDDVFFFRYYSGSIYAEANPYDNRKLPGYLHGKEIDIEAQRIEETMRSMEYYVWEYFLGEGKE
jgi:hypothetical protein